MMVTYSPRTSAVAVNVEVTITGTTVPTWVASGDVRTTYPLSPDNPYAR